jgi:beta-glucosidase
MPELADYMDPSLSPEQRCQLLLGRMTLEEKVGQMCQYVGEAAASDTGNVDEKVGYALALGDKVELVRAGRIGSFLKVPGAAEANTLQELAAASRLKIPLLIGTDAIHGHGMDLAAATIFPSPIGIASTFDPDLAERIAACTAREMRATGFHWSFSPNVDITRDPRWGRTGETFGEDPWLTGELGAAMVRGYQGTDFTGATQVLACAKHLVGGGVPENGLNGASSELSERSLHEVYYPPFIKALQAGAYTLMPSHNDVNGIPCHADQNMLGGLLRGAWSFQGFVISDWLDIARLHSVHRVAATRRDADRIAVLAGVDMHMHGGEFFENLCSLVLEGEVPLGRIDDAVRKILLAKFRLGLFEHRYSKPEQIQAVVLAPAHVQLALEASRKSIVLLQNARGLLPLEGVRSLLVTGPNADDQSILGDWARVQPAANVVTVLQGIRALAAPDVRVDHVPVGPIAHISDAQIQATVRAAAAVDVIIAVVGENSLRDNPERTLGENVDRVSLELPGRQLELVAALAATGKPVVVVLVNGAPIGSEELATHAAALIEAWEPGMQGGTALAEVLFGKHNPSGKLPMSFPRSVGHLKGYYNHRPSAYHRGKFRFASSGPLFGFGHGLSYTQFAYRALHVNDTLSIGEKLRVDVELENTGSRAGEEVVLLYVQDVYASVTRPVKELKAFQRVQLEPGQKKTVQLVLEPDAFSLFDANLKKVIEPGEFRLSLGVDGLEKSVWVK